MRRELWKISGHEGFYSQNMYPPMELDDAEYRLKPMNCPGHILIYKNSPKSYRDLPVRYAELGNVYRYERSGTMHGLLRVRGFTQDDAHIFCTPEQIESEIEDCLDFAEAVLKTFGFKEYRGRALDCGTRRRPDELCRQGCRLGEAPSRSLKEVLTKRGIPFKSIPGEGGVLRAEDRYQAGRCAGPVVAALDGAVRLQPAARFELEYKGEDGELHQPVMVHRALFGSVERFFGVLIEHYAGAFPLWLAPVQVGLVPISEKHLEYADSGEGEARGCGTARGARCAQREDECEDPRVHAAEGAVCPGDGR